MTSDEILGPDELLRGRPFTDPEHTLHEVDVMQAMLEDERARARSWLREEDRNGTHVVREVDEEGRRHLLLVPDADALVESSDLTAVGFFGNPREDVDHTILFTLEEELLHQMP